MSGAPGRPIPYKALYIAFCVYVKERQDEPDVLVSENAINNRRDIRFEPLGGHSVLHVVSFLPQ